MSTCLTIEKVKELLEKLCAATKSTLPAPLPSEIANKVINLDRDIILSPGWDRYLDMKDGEIYFANKKTGVRIDNKPHDTPGRSFYLSEDSDITGSHNSSYTTDDTDFGQSGHDIEEEAKVDVVDDHLVVVGCKRCYKYILAKNGTKGCPDCGETLIQFVNERCV